ncbi:hypothetical protein [Thalassiella azotivora]
MSDADAIHLADEATREDLGTYLARARRVDPDGDARLSGHGPVLAVYVSPLHGAGLPTVVGLRTVALAEPWDGDLVTPLGGLTDRLARRDGGPTLPLPPVESTGVAWAGISPPRSGWEPVGEVPSASVAASAAGGIAEIASGTPQGAGSAAVATLRATVWSRSAHWSRSWTASVPDGAAFAAEALGFLPRGAPDAPVAVLASGSWVRLSAPGGHVLVRKPLLA